MSTLFNVRNESVSQLRFSPDITGKSFVTLDITDLTAGLRLIVAYLATLDAATLAKLSVARLTDGLKTAIRTRGLVSLRPIYDGLDDERRTALETRARELATADIKLPLIAVLLDAKRIVAFLARQYVAADAAGQPRPHYTLAGLKSDLKSAIVEYGANGLLGWDAGISETPGDDLADYAVTVEHAALRAAFDLLPLLFDVPPAPAADAATGDAETVETVESAESVETATETVETIDAPELVESVESADAETADTRSVKRLRAALKSAGVEFNRRAGLVELRALAAAHNV